MMLYPHRQQRLAKLSFEERMARWHGKYGTVIDLHNKGFTNKEIAAVTKLSPDYCCYLIQMGRYNKPLRQE